MAKDGVEAKLKYMLPSADFNLEDSDEEEYEDALNDTTVTAEDISERNPSQSDEISVDTTDHSCDTAREKPSFSKDEDEDWQQFQLQFEKQFSEEIDISLKEPTVAVSEEVLHNLKQQLLADLLTCWHDAKALPNDAKEEEGATNPPEGKHGSKLSFSKLNAVEDKIDDLLTKQQEVTSEPPGASSNSESFQCSAYGEVYSAATYSKEVMKQLVAKYLKDHQKTLPSEETPTLPVTTSNQKFDGGYGTLKDEINEPPIILDLRVQRNTKTQPQPHRPVKEVVPPKASVFSSKALKIFSGRFGSLSPQELSASEGEGEDENPLSWQTVRSRKQKYNVTKTSDKNMEHLETPSQLPQKQEEARPSATVSEEGAKLQMPIPRKHKKKSKSQKKKGSSNAPTESVERQSSSDVLEDQQLTVAVSPSKAKKKKRKKTTGSSSDDGFLGDEKAEVTHNKSKNKKKKPQKLNLLATTSKTEESSSDKSISPSKEKSSPKLSPSSKSSRLKSFTPLEMGPDDDPLFGSSPTFSFLSAAERVEKVKQFLLRQIEGRQHLLSTPSTDTAFDNEESFGPSLSVLPHASQLPEVVLIIPLRSDGLFLLPHQIEALPQSIHEKLHNILVTWLITSVVEETPFGANTIERKRLGSSISDSEFTGILLEDSVLSVSSGSMTFAISGFVQTLYAGKPAIVCAPSGQDPVEGYLKSVSFSNLLSALSMQEAVQHLLEKLTDENSPILSLPLFDIMVISNDTGPLSRHIGFHWDAIQPNTTSPSGVSSSEPVQNTAVVIQSHSLYKGSFIFQLLSRISAAALDVSGLRTAYLSDGKISVALAIRGVNAVSTIADIVGPDDPSLAAITDPHSLSAKFGKPGEELVQFPHAHFGAGASIAKWFGGRCNLFDRTIVGMTDAETKFERRKRQKVRFSDTPIECPTSPEEAVIPSPMVILLVYPVSKVLLVIPPHVYPSSYGTVIETVSKLGFAVSGVRRVRLNAKRASLLQIPKQYMELYLPRGTILMSGSDAISSPTSPTIQPALPSTPPRPSLILILEKENAIRHLSILVQSICHSLQNSTSAVCSPGEPSSYSSTYWIHGVALPEKFSDIFGPVINSPTKPVHDYGNDTKPNKKWEEELVLVGIPGGNSLETVAGFLQDALNASATRVISEPQRGFDLLGMKWLVALSRYQVKQMIPNLFTGSTYNVENLTNVQMFFIALKAISGHKRLEMQLKDNSSKTLSTVRKIIHSLDSGAAYSMICLLFDEKELFSDPTNSTLTQFFPPIMQHRQNILQSYLAPKPCLTTVISVDVEQYKSFLKILHKIVRCNAMLVGCTSIKKKGAQISKHIILAVQRENAIWYLSQELKYFQQASQISSNSVEWSDSYERACEDIDTYFPNGLCCSPDSVSSMMLTSKENFPCIDQPMLYDSEWCLSTSGESPLTETTCILIHQMAFTSLPELLEGLQALRFVVKHLMLIMLSSDRARCLAVVAEKPEKASSLTGLCLAVVLRRDNAASCFHSLVQSNQSLRELLQHVTFPSNLKQVSTFFDTLKQ